MLDYWWPKRDDRGLLQIESRAAEQNDRFYDVNTPVQTLSLAVSLLEAAARLDSDTDRARWMRSRASRLCSASRYTQDERLLDWARSVGDRCATEPLSH
jgi:hypothetical protein